jgi:heme-degrading monooxygenase HmoA
MSIVVVFRNRLRPEAEEAYRAYAPHIAALAQEQPGLLSFKTFIASDGERVTIAEFESDDAVKAWRDHTTHREAQERGKSEFYHEYRLQVCAVLRESQQP